MSEKTIEYCSNCDGEVEIPTDKHSNCPDCGHEIIPCSVCAHTTTKRAPCDWDEKKGCWNYPKARKYRVEAQILIVETIEANSEDEACRKMGEILMNDYADLDWNIDASEKEVD